MFFYVGKIRASFSFIYPADTPEAKDNTSCTEGMENVVPYGDGICLELNEQPKTVGAAEK